MAEVSREEKITRFLLDRKTVRSDGTLRWQALLPNSTGKTSVFRIFALSEEQIWTIGLEKVAAVRQEDLFGRADLIASTVYDKALQFLPDSSSLSRHVDIIGWPDDKDRRKAIALELAAEADVRIKRGMS